MLYVSSTLLLLKAFLEPINCNLQIINGQFSHFLSTMEGHFGHLEFLLLSAFFLSTMFSGSIHIYTASITIVCEIYIPLDSSKNKEALFSSNWVVKNAWTNSHMFRK